MNGLLYTRFITKILLILVILHSTYSALYFREMVQWTKCPSWKCGGVKLSSISCRAVHIFGTYLYQICDYHYLAEYE